MRSLLPIALCLAPAALLAQEIREAALPANVPSVLNHPHNWNADDCETGWVRLEVVEAPRHGALALRSGTYVIGDFGGGRRTSGPGATGCEGVPFNGAQLVYEPDPGFRGTDAFAYRIVSEFIPPFERAYAVTVGR